MNLLLDTHALLWFASGSKELSSTAKEKIKDLNNTCFLSAASLWEIAVKISIGKLKLDYSFQDLLSQVKENSIRILPLDQTHFIKLLKLPQHHKDPFDRIIICQAIAEDFPVITKDENFKSYKINVIWD